MARGTRRGKPAAGGEGRGLHRRVRTARGRRPSSTRWLERQLNDPYVAAAKRHGYRSRAAFKLVELDERYSFLSRGARVVDLGAAPGGWSQVVVQRIGPTGAVLAVDCNPMDAVAGVPALVLDILEAGAGETIMAALDGPVDVVLSDMAAPATGNKTADHLRIVGLCERAADLACEVLAPGGSFVCKVLKGGAEAELLARLKRAFRQVRHAKPAASRPESAETYLVAMGFRGR